MALKSAVKSEFVLLLKSKSSARMHRNQWGTLEWVVIGSELSGSRSTVGHTAFHTICKRVHD